MFTVPLLFYFLVFVLVVHFVSKRGPPRRENANMPLVVNRRGGRIVPSVRGGRGARGGFGIPRMPILDDEKVQEEPTPSSFERPAQAGEFEPDLDDVFAVKDLLKRAGPLPDEIALMILDSAEYWACSSTTVDYTGLPQKHLLLRGTQTENQFLVRSEPLGMTNWSPDDQEAWRLQAIPQELKAEIPRSKLQNYIDERLESVLENPCRKIVFKIQSNDQGWGGNLGERGTFNGSWTWFDAGLERFAAETGASDTSLQKNPNITVNMLRPVWPKPIADGSDSTRYNHELHAAPDHKIQSNRTASRQTQEHVVEWRYNDDVDPEMSAADELNDAGRGRATGNGEFVRSLRLGDVVTVWGRARFGGWQNHIKKVEVKVYWKAV